MPELSEVMSAMLSRVRSAALVLPIVLLWAGDGGGAAGDTAGNGEVGGPLAASSDGRRLVSASGTPVLVLGDAAQALIVNLSTAQADTYFAARAEQGFNAAWVNVLVTTYTGGREDATTYDGIAPFTQTLSSDPTNTTSGFPNETYFAHVDEIVDTAAAHGIHLFFDPIETGGFLDTLSANGLAAAREYGRFLGRRYKDANNIVWMSGNDFRDWIDAYYDERVYAVALGIRDEDPRHLHTTSSATRSRARSTIRAGIQSSGSTTPTHTFRPTRSCTWTGSGIRTCPTCSSRATTRARRSGTRLM
jgi:hypothetical protein